MLNVKGVDNINTTDQDRTAPGGAEGRISANVSVDDRAFVSLSHYHLFSVPHFTLKFPSAFLA